MCIRDRCSSSAANDNRAITIEVASDTKHPYAVNDKAYAALIDLVEDICRRNGIKKLVWSTSKDDRVNHKNGCNMTVHRDCLLYTSRYLYVDSSYLQIAVGDNLFRYSADANAENLEVSIYHNNLYLGV